MLAFSSHALIQIHPHFSSRILIIIERNPFKTLNEGTNFSENDHGKKANECI